MHNVFTWLNDKKIDQIHHVALRSVFMFTLNFNVAKVVGNNATALVTLVNRDNLGAVTINGVQLIRASMHILSKHDNFQHKYTYEQYHYKTSLSNSSSICNDWPQITMCYSINQVYCWYSKCMCTWINNSQNLKITRKLVLLDFISCPLHGAA